MKINKALLLLFISSLLLFSCSKDDEVAPKNNPLLGKWQIVRTKGMNDCSAKSYIEFEETSFKKEDFSLVRISLPLKVSVALNSPCLSSKYNYNYTVSGDIIKAERLANNQLIDIKFSITENKLTLTENGNTTVYEK